MTKALILVMNMFPVQLSTPIQREEDGVGSEVGDEEMAQSHQFAILVVVEDMIADTELVIRVLVEGNLEFEQVILSTTHPTTKMECLHTFKPLRWPNIGQNRYRQNCQKPIARFFNFIYE